MTPGLKAQPGKKTVKKPVGDATRTARAVAHLERLAEAKGKRVVVDLAEPACIAMATLIEHGYETTQKGVITKALLAAEKKISTKS